MAAAQVTIINHGSEWLVALISAGAAILGALLGALGALLLERKKERAREAAEHLARLTEFSAATNAWAAFVSA